jgi:hypothetical protein
MKPSNHRGAAFVALWLFALGLMLCGANAVAQSSPQNFTREVKHAETMPLREMPNVSERLAPRNFVHKVLRLPPIPGAIGASNALRPDAVAQSIITRSSAIPTLGLNFLGEGVDLGGLGGDPSDSNGAIGATQYVEWINTSIEIFNKTTGVPELGTPMAGNTLFSALGGDCASTNDGDPIALYDKAADRWILAQFSVANGAISGIFHECVAVSSSNDATGSYHLYDFQYSNFNDYPKIGVWSDKYLATFNMFDPTGTTFVGGEMCAWDRTNMLAGNPVNQACTAPDVSHGGILPSDIDGLTAPPSSEHGFFLGLDTSNTLALWSVNNVNYGTGTLTLNAAAIINVNSYIEACNGGTCMPQNDGGTQPLDSLGDRMMYRLAYRNFGDHEALVANHSVDVSGTGTGQAGIRWYEIRNPGGTPAVYQQGTYAPNTDYRWMGSIAMDHSGNIAVGYSRSSSSLDPSIYISTRAPSDGLGTLGSETLIQTGTGATSGDSRWGDYTAMTVDPIDDCTMWYIDQYLVTSGQFNWDTRIASFKMPGCSAPPSLVSVTPSSGSGLGPQTFSFVYSDPNGFAYLNSLKALFSLTGGFPNSCYFLYIPSAHGLYLFNDAGTSWLGPMTPGVAGTLQNSQCSVNVGSSSASGSANNLTMNLAVTFTSSFAGTQTTFMKADDNGGQSSAWRIMGSWSVP